MTQTTNAQTIKGPVLALDPGQKLVGVALSDDLLVTIKALLPLKRSSWKRLLLDVQGLVQRFDAKTLVIGLPLRLDGTEGSAANEVRHLATNFSRSLGIPVYLQDERLTSFAAREELLSEGHSEGEIPNLIDCAAAAIILRDFITTNHERILVKPIKNELTQ